MERLVGRQDVDRLAAVLGVDDLRIKQEVRMNCPTCHGKGITKCERCRGTGAVSSFPSTIKCGTCEGKGQIVCPNCNGKGQVYR